MNVHFFLIVAAVIGSSHTIPSSHSNLPDDTTLTNIYRLCTGFTYPHHQGKRSSGVNPGITQPPENYTVHSGEWRPPKSTDIEVTCGAAYIILECQACGIYYAGYNASQMILNNNLEPACRGTLDTSVFPPVVRFSFPLNPTDACGSIFRTTGNGGVMVTHHHSSNVSGNARRRRSTASTGVFSSPTSRFFSNNSMTLSTNIKMTVNVSGVVRASDPTTGTVTYRSELKYYYSCAYPLEYLINNQIDVSASSIALRDKNGSFVSTLSLELFSDKQYERPLLMPQDGIELRTRIYVEVKATNLTGQYNVLLDRCYASVSPLPSNSSFFNLLMPCGAHDQLTTVIQNGVSQSARFSFPAFRFMEQQNEIVSTYYLHCITRLCEISSCPTFMECKSGRRRRSAAAAEEGDGDGLSHQHTITSPEIVTQENLISAGHTAGQTKTQESSSTGLGAAVGVLAFVCVVNLCVAAVFYKKLKN